MNIDQFKRLYSQVTRCGEMWSLSSISTDIVVGYVYSDNRWVEASWRIDQNGDLRSQQYRSNDVLRLIQEPIINNSSARSLNQPFVVSDTRTAYVSYTLSCFNPLSLLTTSSGCVVSLLVDNVKIQSTGEQTDASLSLGLSINTTNIVVLSAIVRSGSVVEIQTEVSGGGSVEYLYGQEALL